MADMKPGSDPKPAKPAGKAEQQAADASTKDGLQAGRESSQTREEVRQEKTNQGQPNRG